MVDLTEYVVGQPQAIDLPKSLRWKLFFAIRKVLVKRLEKAPVEPYPLLGPRTIRTKQDSIRILEQELARAEIGCLPNSPMRDASSTYRFGYLSSHCLTVSKSSGLFATCAPTKVVVGCLAIMRFRARQQVVSWGISVTVKAPIRMPTELFPTFVLWRDGLKKSSRIGCVY